MRKNWNSRHVLVVMGVAVLIGAFALQLFLSVREESISWDEDDHIFAGYMTWKNSDFGLNPEHPPLVKLIAALPLLNMPLQVPALQNRNFKLDAFLGGKDFVFKNDADAIVNRSRIASSIFAFSLLILVFVAGKEMFGMGAAFVALGLLAFDPNLLAHGAMVATDTAVSCLLFASIYAFYRYVKCPGWTRLTMAGVVAGLALATKHSTILLLPMVLILALCEIACERGTQSDAPDVRRQTYRLIGAVLVMSAIAITALWAFYGFRYAARPAGLALNPPLPETIAMLKRTHEAAFVSWVSQWRLLPESYLYGLVDVRIMSDFYRTFLLGKIYSHGVWFYFPFVFLIKTTIGVLFLTLVTVVAFATRKLRFSREVRFIAIPPIVYLIVAMVSGMNIGLRHILPVYVFLYLLIGAAATQLMRHWRKWGYVIGVLILLHIGSSVRAYPDYIPYANELWGGPSNTYKLLSDSNADWAQQLKATGKYLSENGVKQCWFAYFAAGVIDTQYYGVRCKLLPTVTTLWLNEETEVPAAIDGPVLISAGTLSGFEFGPGPNLNPYEQFKSMKPTAVIQRGVFVFDGHFDVPLAAAISGVQKAGNLLAQGKAEAALVEAEQAVELAPNSVNARAALGDTFAALKRRDEALIQYQRALDLARTVEPNFQSGWIEALEQKLRETAQVAVQ